MCLKELLILLAHKLQFVFILTVHELKDMTEYSEVFNALTDYLSRNLFVK